MELMVTLDGPAAAWLRERAVSRNVPPEKAASDILGEVLKSLAADEAWVRQNERRHDLIRKKFDGGLTHGEEAELAGLQGVAAERVAPLDRLMTARVEEALKRLKGPHDDAGA